MAKKIHYTNYGFVRRDILEGKELKKEVLVMKQEDRDLLLQDLSNRLANGVKIETNSVPRKLFAMDLTLDVLPRPFLRPISSLTDDERHNLGRLIETAAYNLLECNFDNLRTLLNHCYENHIDIFGLIEKGCAIAITEENNPYK